MKVSYFENFNTVPYRINDAGQAVQLTNITPGFGVNRVVKNRIVGYTKYRVLDGERPDIVSQKLYGTPSYYWTFFVINENLRSGGIGSWPLSDHDLNDVISAKYDNYAVLTFDPITPFSVDPYSGVIRGNTSYVPFKEDTYPFLYIKPVSNEGEILSTRARIISYDYETCQMVISRRLSNADISIDDFVNNYASYVIQAESSSSSQDAAVQEYKATVALSYGLEDPEATQNIVYELALNQNFEKLTWPYMRNATHVYYERDSVTGNTVTLSTFDILTSGREYSVTTTPIEELYENINNFQEVLNINYEDVLDDDGLNVLSLAPINEPKRYCSANFTSLKSLSYSDKERIENDQKSLINVISPAEIKKFSVDYFNLVRST